MTDFIDTRPLWLERFGSRPEGGKSAVRRSRRRKRIAWGLDEEPESPKRMNTPGLSLLALIACCGCASTDVPRATAQVATLSSEPDWTAFPLGPQDIVRVGVYGHPELGTSATRVDMEGNLSLPLVGPVLVAGLSVSDARAAITAAYATYVQSPQVDVSIVTHGARKLYVFGEVTRPGALEFDRPLTVMQALSLVGGFTSKADRSEVVLLRGTPENLEVAVIDAEAPTRELFLAMRSDDVLFVRRTNAGKFSDEILPYLQGISSSLSSAATIVLLDDRLGDKN